MTLSGVKLTAVAGGAGGGGGDGQTGQASPLTSASGVGGGCSDGAGGHGGSGGGGGAGAGGSSIGLAYAGTTPNIDGRDVPNAQTLDGVTFAAGPSKAGKHGNGGATIPGSNPASNAGDPGGDGANGATQAVLAAP